MLGHPAPDPTPWVEIRDPQERLRTALSELYDFYARTEPMRANVLRDAESMPELAAPSEDVRRHRNLRKNWRMSPTRRSGASWAAQWLPRSNSLQETMLAWSRSANLRMGRKS